jgi:hypothetical protein
LLRKLALGFEPLTSGLVLLRLLDERAMLVGARATRFAVFVDLPGLLTTPRIISGLEALQHPHLGAIELAHCLNVPLGAGGCCNPLDHLLCNSERALADIICCESECRAELRDICLRNSAVCVELGGKAVSGCQCFLQELDEGLAAILTPLGVLQHLVHVARFNVTGWPHIWLLLIQS